VSAAELIRARVGARRPRLALVLGSGLAGLAEDVEDAVRIPYAELDGWPRPTVPGHAGELVLGAFAGREVAALKGRTHFYEDGRPDAMRPAVETLAALGVESLVLTNAAGSLRPGLAPGDLMLIADHIAFGPNPLVGDRGDQRFVDLRDAYDTGLRGHFRRAAERLDVPLAEGVYMWFSGPSFETPAEIRMARLLGADAVGMSTVPEVVLARRFGLKVAAVSAITNMGAGLADERLSHAHTQAQAARAAGGLAALLRAAVADWP
jgi:purine-nucleoside phosphorylase